MESKEEKQYFETEALTILQDSIVYEKNPNEMVLKSSRQAKVYLHNTGTSNYMSIKFDNNSCMQEFYLFPNDKF